MAEELLFWGPTKIISATKSDKVTPSGNAILELVLDDKFNPLVLVPEKSYLAFATKEPLDATAFRDKLNETISREVVGIFLEYDIKSMDLLSLLTYIGDKVQNAFERASNYLWTGDDKQWIPGMNFLNNRTILEADRVLSKLMENKPDADKEQVAE